MSRSMRPGASGVPPGREGGIHTAKAIVLIGVLVVIGVIVLNRATATSKGRPAAGGTTTHATTTIKAGR